jgi:hypothetical protein
VWNTRVIVEHGAYCVASKSVVLTKCYQVAQMEDEFRVQTYQVFKNPFDFNVSCYLNKVIDPTVCSYCSVIAVGQYTEH